MPRFLVTMVKELVADNGTDARRIAREHTPDDVVCVEDLDQQRNSKSMIFDTNGEPGKIPDTPLDERTLEALGFVRIRRSTEPDSWGSYWMQQAFFTRPTLKTIIERIQAESYRNGERQAKATIRHALGV